MAIPKLTLHAGTNPVEGGANGVFTIALDSPAPAGGLSINFDTTGSTATFGTDYALMAGANVSNVTANAFTIADGATTATLSLAVLADTVADPNETVAVALTPGTGYSLASSGVAFAAKVDYPTGEYSSSVGTGDFNNDGKTDLAVVNMDDRTVSVFLRNATNTGFDAKANYATGLQPVSVSIGDFNNDGKADLAVANYFGNTVSVLLRNATNTGFIKVDYKAGRNPYSVGVGDFNNDGKADLAVANNINSGTVSVLLRNTTNTGFDAKVDYVTGKAPFSVSTGDFNNDGKTDLAVANYASNTVSVLLRNATNTSFDAKVDYATGDQPVSVSVGDFNNDGKTDLTVANLDKTVSVLLRNATNTGFDAKVDYLAGDGNINGSKVIVGDFNNDGKTDLAIDNWSSKTVSVLLHNADITGFDAKVDYATGKAPSSVSAGDFNNDGKTDLAVANGFSDTVSVLLNTSTPSAHAALTIADVASILNRPPILSGAPAILTNSTENSAYTLNASDLLQGFSDADGDTLSITNLVADKGVLADNNDGTWTVTPDGNFNGTITLSYTVSDSKGGVVAANNTFTLTAANHAPVGAVSINDTTPQQGQTLTASNTLTDADGLGVISYSWKTDSTLLGTGSNYTVTANDLGKALSVTASYTDSLGNPESISSASTSAVTASASAGFTISPTTAPVTGEDGTIANYSIQLNTAPLVNQNVVITFTSTDTSEGVIDNPTLTFSPTNYATPQTLTVRGVDDYLDDGDIPYLVIAKVTTLDVFYKTLAINAFNLTNTDDGLDKALDLYGDEGGSKIDVMNGGNGADKLHGLNRGDNLSGGLGNDSLWGGYGDDNLFGEDGDDKLSGEQENDYLDGGAGNDWLDGGDGIDTMIGGAGNDTYILGFDAIDVISDNGLSTDVDTVIMPYQLSKYTLPVGIEQGTISAGTQASSLTGNTGNNTLTGNDGKNTLSGAVGRDSLFGGLGNDVLNGGTDDDVLRGGTGKDSFVFNAALKANVDKITDFKPIDDTIKLENQIFTKLTVPGVLDAGLFFVGVAAHDPNDYFIYNPTTGAMTYDPDGSGAGQGLQIAVLGLNLLLTNADFVVI